MLIENINGPGCLHCLQQTFDPPSSWPAAAWPLAVTDLFWTWPQRLSGDWSFLHCGILCRYFSYFTFPSMPGNWGQGKGSISASLDRPGLLWLKAQLQHLVLGVLLLLTTGTPGTSWAHSFRDLCPLRPFPYLLFLPGACLESGTESFTWEELSQTPKTGAFPKLKLKNSLKQSALFPC